MLVADVIAFLQIALVGDVHAGLALDRLDEETGNLVAVLLQHLLQRVGVVVGYADETGSHRAVVGIALRVVAHSDDGDGAAVEVAFAADNHNLVVLDAFLDDAPAAGQLQGCLVGLGTAVHRQHLLIAEIFGHVFFPLAKAVVIESAAREGQLVGLVAEGLDDFRVAMALVDSRIGRKEVEILFAFAVPHKSAFAFGQHYG